MTVIESDTELVEQANSRLGSAENGMPWAKPGNPVFVELWFGAFCDKHLAQKCREKECFHLFWIAVGILTRRLLKAG